MKNKKTILIISLIFIIISCFIIFNYIKCMNFKSSPKNEEIILKDESYKGEQFPIFILCKNDEDIINSKNMCNENENSKKYLTVMSPLSKVETYQGTNYKTGILFKDYNLRLIDVKKREEFILDLGENDSYKLLINNEDKIIGIIYQKEEKYSFYSYKLKKTIYKEYDKIDFINDTLLGIKENHLYILDENNEKNKKETNSIVSSINDIIYAKKLNNIIHINTRNQEGEYEYIIFDKKEDKINKISGFYEEVILINDKIYTIKNNTIEIYNPKGTLITTNTINKGTHFKIVDNYIVTLVGKEIKIINMDTKEKTTLLENGLNLWISEEKYEKENNSITMLFQEIMFDEYPKMYEVTFNKTTKEVKIKNFN